MSIGQILFVFALVVFTLMTGTGFVLQGDTLRAGAPVARLGGVLVISGIALLVMTVVFGALIAGMTSV